MTGFVIDRYGRKCALILCVVPGMIGWFLMATSQSVVQLFAGRFLTGLSTGATFFPPAVYMAEYIDMDPNLSHLRTSFTNWVHAASTFGFLLVISIGAFLPYYVVAFITSVLAFCVFCCIIIFIPESPMWLHEMGRYGDAEWSQKRLKLKVSFESYSLESTTKENDSNIVKKFFRRDVYCPILITTGFTSLMVLCGTSILTSYLVNLTDLNGSYSLQDSYYLSVVSAVLQFVGTVANIFTIPYTGVRKILTCSALGVAVAMITYGVSNCFIDSVYHEIARVISLAAVWLGIFCAGFGFTSIPRGLLGELFPTDAKTFAIVPTITMYIVQSMVTKFHPYLAVNFGGLVFFVYGGFAIIDSLCAYSFLPETVGKTAKQINDEFRK